MSSIDEVISRSRQGSAMGEHKTFSIARNRAIEKMRNFALADPHFFALELIQGSVANGATYIDIASEDKFFALSYIGGGFQEDDLSQLFDFLFASKADMSQSAMRQMALGINALMLMQPEQITMVSGDGTKEGTSQITIRDERVMVGTPDHPLNGTFINAEGLKRRLVASKSNVRGSLGGGPECTIIEDRCLAAPVPMLVNNNAIFGYASMKHPVLYGYDRVVSFDEGDLYGSLGLSTRGVPRHEFKLLTYGVWAQTISHELVKTQSIGGIITFDRLNKTADHAAIVQDERVQELWARLMPYAQQLMEGKSGKVTYKFRFLNNQVIDAIETRQLLKAHDFVLCVDPDLDINHSHARRAIELSEALNAPILRVDPSMRENLKHMGGNQTTILEPNLKSNEELAFYLQKTIEPPDQPWLLDRMDLKPFDLTDVVNWISNDERRASPTIKAMWGNALGGQYQEESFKPRLTGAKTQDIERTVSYQPVAPKVNMTLYVPKNAPADTDGVHVRLLSLERLIWEGIIEGPYSGFVLDIALTNVVPQDLTQHVHPPTDESAGLTLAQAVARVCTRRLHDSFEQATAMIFESLRAEDIDPKTISARRVLSSVARDSILRLRKLSEDAQHLELTLTMLTKSRLDLLNLPILQTHAGTTISLRTLVEQMRQQYGLYYGTIPDIEVALDGLDLTRVLDLSPWEERLLLSIFGESAYVRIDVRNFLASITEPLAHVRDMAVGLKAFDTRLPVLIEHGDIDAMVQNQQDTAVCTQLLRQLHALALGHLDILEQTLATQVQDMQDGLLELEELCIENRRQAIRHLQWFIAHQKPGAPTLGIEHMPLFLDHAGTPCSWHALQQHPEQLTMLDGRSRDTPVLLTFGHGKKTTDKQPDGGALTMNAYVYYLLRDKLEMTSAFDFDFAAHEALKIESTPDEAFLVSKRQQIDHIDAHIGLAATPRDHYTFACVWPNGEVKSVANLADNFGLVGTLRIKAEHTGEIEDYRLLGLCRDVIAQLVSDLSTWPRHSDKWTIGVATLLRYTQLRIQLIEQQGGHVYLEHQDAALVQRILNMPLFDTVRGMPISATRLIQIFCLTQHTNTQPWRDILIEDLHPVLARWIGEVLNRQAIVRLPSSQRRVARPLLDSPFHPKYLNDTEQQFCRLVHDWLEKLRPDNVPLHHVHLIYPSAPRHNEHMRYWAATNKKDPPPMLYLIDRDEHILLLNAEHPFIQHHQAHKHISQELSWLLLASYACINEWLDEVTNHDELIFQQRLIDTLLL